jgi:hypothetical protein
MLVIKLLINCLISTSLHDMLEYKMERTHGCLYNNGEILPIIYSPQVLLKQLCIDKSNRAQDLENPVCSPVSEEERT